MDWAEIAKCVALACGVAAGLFIGWKEWRDKRRAKRTGLMPNPARCEDHEGRIREVEKVCNTVIPKLDGLERDMIEVRAGVDRLIDIHLKQ